MEQKEKEMSQEAPIQEASPSGQEKPELSAEAPSELIRHIDIEISAEKIEGAFMAYAARMAREARLPGFRQGHAPVAQVAALYRDAIMSETVTQQLEEEAQRVIRQQNLRPAVTPEIEEVDHPEGQALRARLKVVLLPEVALPELSTLKANKPEGEAEAFDLEKARDGFLDRNRRKVPVLDRPLQLGDEVHLKVQNRNTQTRRLWPTKDEVLTLSEKEAGKESVGTPGNTDLPADASSLLLGKAIGEQLSVEQSYPADYPRKAWAGTTLEHQITISSAFEMKKPDLDETFLKSLGLDSVEELDRRLQEGWEKSAEQRLERQLEEARLAAVVASVAVEIPQPMIDQDVDRQIRSFGMDPRTLQDRSKVDSMLAPTAQERIRTTLVVDALIQKHNLTPTAEEIRAEIAHIASTQGYPEREVARYYEEPEHREQLAQALAQKKIHSFLKEQVRIEGEA